MPQPECDHPDVRYCASEKGAIACFKCGRLFGHLDRGDDTFTPHNPGPGGWGAGLSAPIREGT